MAAPYLIVGLAGDSNGMWGKYRLTDGTDDAGSRIFQYKRDGTVVAANEPLDNLGYSAADSQAGQVGSTVALCRLLRDNGHLPDGFDILIVPHCWAGTAFLNFWATTGDRNALDGGGGDTIGFLAHLSNAVALHAENRIWFFDWNHGANDSGAASLSYQSNMLAMWNEIRSTVPTAANAPILVTGLPPDRYTPGLGPSTQSSYQGVIDAQEDVATYLDMAIYVSPVGRRSDATNGFVHFHAESHRGGVVAGPYAAGVIPAGETEPIPAADQGETITVADSLAGRKYQGLLALGVIGFSPTEIYMWLPDVVAVVVRDAPPVKGIITPVYQDESATAYETWVDRTDPRDSVTRKALIVGPTKNYLRIQDQLSATFLDRDAATDPANWTFTGFAGTITKVVLLVEPYDHALTTHSGPVLQTVQQHTLLLHLSANLPEATYTIGNATAEIAATNFTFDDTVTRAGGIHVNQVGHRPSDLFKMAILAKRLPFGPGGGVINFSDYGFSTFNVLNESKNVVFTGSITQRVGPDDVEPGYANICVADYGRPIAITGISNADPGVVEGTAHGLVAGERFRFRGIGGMTSLETALKMVGPSPNANDFEIWDSQDIGSISAANPAVVTTKVVSGTVPPAHGYSTGNTVAIHGTGTSLDGTTQTITVITTTTFSLDGIDGASIGAYTAGDGWFGRRFNTTSIGTFTTGTWSTADGGYDSLIYPCVLMNRAGTYCYSLDFSASSLAAGTYYSQIPGYGIGDPFRVTEAAYSIATGWNHKGLYSLRRGIAVTSGEYSRGANMRDDGILHFRNYRSKMPAALIGENAGNSNVPEFATGMAPIEPAITNDRITLTNSGWGHQDAGDLDTYLTDHMPMFVNLMSMLLEVPQASRVTNFTVPLSSVAIGSRYAGTDHWPPLMHECAWFVDFWLNLQQPDGSVLSGLSVGHFSSQSANFGESSDIYRGNNSRNVDTNLITGPGNLVHGAILAADHWSNYWVATGFALFSVLCAEYGNTTLSDTYKQAAIDAYDWAESMRISHAGDGSVRDAYYDTYLGLKTLPVFGAGQASQAPRLSSVNTSTDIVTITASHGYASGTKVRVRSGVGTLPGNLSEDTDYWINVSGNNISFHTNVTDAGTGANKIDLTAGFVSGPYVFRVLTDAEYVNHMTFLDGRVSGISASGNAAARYQAAGALLRCVGWESGSAYAALFAAAGTPSPDHWHTWHYMRAAQAAGVDGSGTPLTIINYIKAHHNTGYVTTVIDYNTNANVAFPAAHNTNTSTQWATAPSQADRQFRSLILAIEAGDTTTKNKILTNLQAHVAFQMGCNLIGKCTISGAGVRNQMILVHDDSLSNGQRHPDGIAGYVWNLWPLAGSVFNNGPEVGPANWIGSNVKTATAAYAQQITEPWKYAQSFWECQLDNRGLITQSEYSIGTSMNNSLVPCLACHLWDDNVQSKFVPVVHFRRRKAA